MFLSIIKSVCAGCGKECGIDEILCENCCNALERPGHFCHSCGYVLKVDASYCRHCVDKEKNIDFYYTDYLYTGALKKAVLEIKFSWRIRGSYQLKKLCKADNIAFEEYDYVVKIPYHFTRNLVRYFQPVNLIRDAIAKKGSLPYKNVLIRNRATEYQSRLSRRERLLNVKNSFEVVCDVSGRNILLVDDILTTGATVKSAASALKEKGASKVSVYTLMAGVPR